MRVLSILGLVVAWSALAAQQPATLPNADQWREDLRYLATELPKTHRNAFHAISREEWSAAVRRLDARIPSLDRAGIIVGMSKLVATIGDGHTCFHSFYDPPISFRRYPVSFYLFSDGLYVRAADPRYAKAVGGKVVTIGKATVEGALDAASAVDGRDNPMWSKLTAPWRLETAEVVAALGLTDDVEHTPLTVEKDGRRITVVLAPEEVPEGERHTSVLPAGWVDARGDKPMLWQQDRAKAYWDVYLPDRRALYVQFNAVEDENDRTLADYFRGVFDFVASHDVDRMVLDMRNNGGGNNYLPRPIIKGIMRSPKLSSRGKVWVIIGRHTFSAAQNTVDWLKKWTDAIFVGEPTGSSPNQFGDAVPVKLPNSGIAPYAATVWWQDIDERSQDRWLAPDVAVEMSGEDYRNGRDPVLEVALTAAPEPSLAEQLRSALATAKVDPERIRELGKRYRADPRHKYASFEESVNLLGYEMMAKRRLDAAVAVLEINAEAFPDSWNAWDSLAEAWMKRGDTAKAVAYYRRSLGLNPKNQNAVAMLAKLGSVP